MKNKQPYQLVSRSFKQEDTVIQIGNCKIGGGSKSIIARPLFCGEP